MFELDYSQTIKPLGKPTYAEGQCGNEKFCGQLSQVILQAASLCSEKCPAIITCENGAIYHVMPFDGYAAVFKENSIYPSSILQGYKK